MREKSLSRLLVLLPMLMGMLGCVSPSPPPPVLTAEEAREAEAEHYIDKLRYWESLDGTITKFRRQKIYDDYANTIAGNNFKIDVTREAFSQLRDPRQYPTFIEMYFFNPDWRPQEAKLRNTYDRSLQDTFSEATQSFTSPADVWSLVDYFHDSSLEVQCRQLAREAILNPSNGWASFWLLQECSALYPEDELFESLRSRVGTSLFQDAIARNSVPELQTISELFSGTELASQAHAAAVRLDFERALSLKSPELLRLHRTIYPSSPYRAQCEELAREFVTEREAARKEQEAKIAEIRASTEARLLEIEKARASLRPTTAFSYTPTSGSYSSGYQRSSASVAENGSYYGQLNSEGRPKTVHVRGYYRKDGTYVRGHYRSAPR